MSNDLNNAPVEDTTDDQKTVPVGDNTKKPRVEVKDPHGRIEIFSNIRKVDLTDDRTAESIIIASGSQKKINTLLAAVDAIETDAIEKEFTPEELSTIGFNYESSDKTIHNDVLYDHINDGTFVNRVTHDDIPVGITKVGVKATGKLSGANAVAKFTSALGIGKHTTVTLWHSGFSLMISPPDDSEMISLQYNIAKLERKLGSDTSNLVYSNYGVVINKLVVDFILSHVISSSLDLPEGESYTDYIKLTDMNLLALAMTSSMRPMGYPVTITCKNSLLLEKDHPVCDYVATADVDPEKLLWVNRNALTKDNLAHISKTSAGSHSVESIIAYQNSLTVNDVSVVNVEATGGDIEFHIKTPTIRDYIDSGELWINNIIAAEEKLFIEGDSTETRENRIDSLILASVLNKYSGYVSSITMDDTYVTDQAGVTGILEAMSGSADISNNLLSGIIKHIDSGYIALAATYTFDCPVCKEAGRDASQGDGNIAGFKEFIPLNAVENFFALSTLRFTQIVNRDR